ncbi:2-aminoethanethiol dioxygenase [Teleopsis dalmanni]|uniref:2-aminoethanethiol dioxygenase n=1 Tax=Teleopsis dalmanni TaxID=139649 RepID=UPI0018CFAEEE|nr:2-aminoethanethiol dioxygenase [Teleopsis dalmanni]
MSSLFVNIMKHTLLTFKNLDKTNQNTFNSNFAILKQLAEQLTYRDLNLNHQELFSDSAFRPGHAPCKFIHIFENDVMSMSVFVMRPGYTMPLHDHPMMYGLLRGIHGKLSVKSYTQHIPTDVPFVYDHSGRDVYAVAEEPTIVSPNTSCAILTPYERNFHEITAVGGIAAFFDILSPPYDADIPNYGTRRCQFYHAKQQTVSDLSLIRLERIAEPLSYYCDTVEVDEAVAKSTNYCTQ